MSHGTDPRNYTKVLIALLVLTVLTVGLSLVPMGTAGNVTVGLLVAVIKASLVVLIFMHLKFEQRWWSIFVIFPLVLVMIILFSNFADTGTNDELTTPAEKVIPHKGKAGPAH